MVDRSPYDEMIIARGDLEDLRERVRQAEGKCLDEERALITQDKLRGKIKLLLKLLYKANKHSSHTIECTLKPPPWDTPCNCWKSEVTKLEIIL